MSDGSKIKILRKSHGDRKGLTLSATQGPEKRLGRREEPLRCFRSLQEAVEPEKNRKTKRPSRGEEG